jgi:hypothetical protein
MKNGECRIENEVSERTAKCTSNGVPPPSSFRQGRLQGSIRLFLVGFMQLEGFGFRTAGGQARRVSRLRIRVLLSAAEFRQFTSGGLQVECHVLDLQPPVVQQTSEVSETHPEIRLSARGFVEKSEERTALILGQRLDLVTGLFDVGSKDFIGHGFSPCHMAGP